MTTYGKCEDLIGLVVNPGNILPNLPLDKVRYLLVETQSMREDYSREIVINYISGNFSSNKHFCNSILSGKEDAVIMDVLDDLEAMINEEIEARKRVASL